MNEKLPAAVATTSPAVGVSEDYRYEAPPYVTPASAKATEATSGLYRGVGAGGIGVGGAPYHISAVPTEFGGTLKSNKSSCGSPRRQSSGAAGRKSTTGPHGSDGAYCACFGGGCSGGSMAHLEVTFWPALLANMGICALLVGYIFIGSFVFLSIENSGRNDVRADDAAAKWHLSAPKPQVSAKQQQQHEQQELQLQANPQKQQQQQQLMFASAAATWTAAAQQAYKDNTTTSTTSNTQHGMPNPVAAYLAATTDAETYNDNMSTKYKRQQHQQQQQQQQPEQQQQLWQLNNNDHVLQTLSLQQEEQAQQDEALSDEDEEPDADGEPLAAVEDVERQRAVENIWDITVSLNILYKENWTKLAALEIQKFQDQLVKRLAMDLTVSTSAEAATANGRDSNAFHAVQMQHNAKHYNGHHQQQHWSHFPQLHVRAGGVGDAGPEEQATGRRGQQQQQFEWNFATAFLYSLTVITTVGYGSISPRTTLGRMVTIGYATIGIPLTLIYLSSIGGILAKLARLLCTRALCCCFCARRHRYCCCLSAPLHTHAKEREIKLKRLRQQQQESIKMRAQQQQQHLAYCYVRPPAQQDAAATELHMLDTSLDTLSVATTTASRSGHANPFGWSLVAPIGLCLLLMLVYVAVGAVAIALLEDWPLLDGIYFCFMSLTTIGFCDLLPGLPTSERGTNTCAVWFCAIYILSGLTLTAMCVNVLHEEILLRMRVVVKFKKVAAKEAKERTYYGAPP